MARLVKLIPFNLASLILAAFVRLSFTFDLCCPEKVEVTQRQLLGSNFHYFFFYRNTVPFYNRC